MKKNIAGIILCVIIALPAWFLGKMMPIIGSPVFAMIFGIIITQFIKDKDKIESGIKFTSKKILQYAIVFLGFGMNFSDILTQGKESLPIILTTITTALVISFLIHKAMKVSSNISVLIGVGSSICGGSAIAATAPVIKAKDEEVAQAISVIFLFNVIAALIFPTLGGMLGFSNEGFGIFAGTAVNDTSSVTAAATAWDGMHNSNVLDTATIVKLTRTLAIVPITLVLSIWESKKSGNEESSFSLKKSFPLFILFFLLAAIITTIFSLSTEVTAPLKDLSKFFITMAMAAIGMNTDVVKLVKSGKKPIFMGFSCWVGISAVTIVMEKLMGTF